LYVLLGCALPRSWVEGTGFGLEEQPAASNASATQQAMGHDRKPIII
jgi:hypothetical protein